MIMRAMRPFDVITFNCYGTLIDWEAGIAEAFLRTAYGCYYELVYGFVKDNFDAYVARLPTESRAGLTRVGGRFCDVEHIIHGNDANEHVA